MTAEPEAVQTLRLARRYLRRGWTQGDWKRRRHLFYVPLPSQYCLVGAVREADGPGCSLALHALNAVLDTDIRRQRRGQPAYRGDAIGRLTEYNDERGRKKREVVQAVDRAIAYVLEQQPDEAEAPLPVKL